METAKGDVQEGWMHGEHREEKSLWERNVLEINVKQEEDRVSFRGEGIRKDRWREQQRVTK